MRRAFVPQLALGDLSLPASQAHHLRDVLRLQAGEKIDVFDNAGNRASAAIVQCDAGGVIVRITAIAAPDQFVTRLRIASAVPKSNRADWLVEKLSEIGVDEWIPLHCQRGVVLPEGKNKFARWQRLAVEAAKQSGRTSAMSIGELITPADLLAKRSPVTWYLSPRQSLPILGRIRRASDCIDLLVLIGPEGGWSEAEIELFHGADIPAVQLTDTVLRIETAALTVAAVLRCWQSGATLLTRS